MKVCGFKTALNLNLKLPNATGMNVSAIAELPMHKPTAQVCDATMTP
jgi:hypothetical protein